MNKILYFVMCGLIAMPAMAASPAGQARRSMQTQMVTNAPRRATTASTNQITAMASAANSTASDTTSENKSSARVEPVADTKTVDMREKEKNACINNNIGIGNTLFGHRVTAIVITMRRWSKIPKILKTTRALFG